MSFENHSEEDSEDLTCDDIDIVDNDPENETEDYTEDCLDVVCDVRYTPKGYEIFNKTTHAWEHLPRYHSMHPEKLQHQTEVYKKTYSTKPYVPTMSVPTTYVNAKPCYFFAQGRCKKGASCTFSHATSVPTPSVPTKTVPCAHTEWLE